MLRLALLAPIEQSIPPQYDGARERQIALLCTGLQNQGIDVTLFASGDSNVDGPLAAVCPGACATDPTPSSQAWEERHLAHLSARAGEFDLIHNHGPTLPLAYSRPLPTPVLTTLYDRPTPLTPRPLERSYYAVLQGATRHPDVPAVATIPPGVALETWTYHAQHGTYLLVYGGIHADAGITAALAIAQQSRLPLILAGPIQDRAYFQNHVAPHLDAERVRYIGPVPAAAYNTLLGEAYALLQVGTASAVQRLSALEALACGTPVVALAGTAMADSLCQGRTGYAVQDVPEATACLGQIPMLQRQHCRGWVATHHTAERMVEAYVKAYIEIIEREKARAHHATPPWGRWEVLLDTPTYKVKRLTVWPGERLSYQKHFQREEHWTVVQGEALITLNDVDTRRSAGEAIDIPRESWHRLANPGNTDLVVIEVQCGDYLGEDDIVRREDNYGRAKTTVHVDGAVGQARTFGFVDFAALPEQVARVNTLLPGREGSAVRLRTVLEAVGLQDEATHVTFCASGDAFTASVPLAAVIDQAVLVYRQGLEPLAATQGGPVRLLVAEATGDSAEGVSACTNVKHLDQIRLTVGPEV